MLRSIMNGNNYTDNSINKHIIQPIFMLKKNSDTFNEIISSDIFTSYCINKLSIDTTCNQFIKLISDKQNYNKSLLCVGYEKGHYYTENCEKCRNDIIANGYVYSCNGYVHGHPFSDNCDLYECKKCKGRKGVLRQMQNRSADEGATTWFDCYLCGASCKF